MKTKTLTVVEIAIVLCSMLVVAMPAIAAEQDDYVLGIYGNANEDDTIDMRDLTYVKLIFFGKKPETGLADAKYDGKINPLDFIQIKLIIVGKEKELTLVDSADRIVTVKEPIERIVVFSEALETMRSIKATDSVVGINKYAVADDIFFPEFSDYPSVGSVWSPDVEKALELEPDLVFLYATFSTSYCDDILDKLEATDPDITVLRFDNYRPGEIYVDETKKMGYVLNKVDETNEFLKFFQGYMNSINERVEGLSEADKKTVYLECWREWHTATKKAGWGQKLEMAGGYNVFGDEPGEYIDVDAEAVIVADPEIIVQVEKKAGGYELDAGDTTVLEEVRDEIMNRTGLEHVTAVENETVYIITNHVIGGTRNFIGIGYLAKWLYPELFSDLGPKAIHQEYLTKFQGLDIDLDEKGVFVYPVL
ncbi:MAG TPA: ABC transporter substrate-binding protein [Methanophagales archaeon]|nr:ABC transporter substrate-binding protein [Methanophagales archaeon]